MRVAGSKAATYGAGQTFYEAANTAHLVSANASRTLPAHFVAYSICGAKV
jgi:quercetin dioxygenase-like cupin family protein